MIDSTTATKALLSMARHGAFKGVPFHTLDMLLAAGADVNGLHEGHTPLHWALVDIGTGEDPSRWLAYQAWLLKHGADVNQRDKNGRTPLHIAAMFHDLTVARALIAAGADASAMDAEGCLPEEIEIDDEFNDLLGEVSPSAHALANAAELRALRIEQEQAALSQAADEAVPNATPAPTTTRRRL